MSNTSPGPDPRQKRSAAPAAAWWRFLADETGPTSVEYCVILMLIFGVIIGVVQVLGGSLNGSFQNSAGQLGDSFQNARGG